MAFDEVVCMTILHSELNIIHKLTLIPYFRSIVYDQPLIDKINNLLKFHNNNVSEPAQNIEPSQVSVYNSSSETEITFSSPLERAKFLVEKKKINFNQSFNRYMVANESNGVYLIDLTQKNFTCTCKAGQGCAHIMAARLYRGEKINSNIEIKPIQLSVLRGNLRDNKKSGKKYRYNEHIAYEKKVPAEKNGIIYYLLLIFYN